MTNPPLAHPVDPSLELPPITQLTVSGAHPPQSGALPDFVARTHSWERHAVRLPIAVTCTFWLVVLLSGGVGAWLIAVLTDNAPCSGLVCTIATVGNHPRLLLVLATFCVTTLLGLALVTHGLTHAGGPELALMVVAAAAGAGSLLGVVAVVVLALTVVLMGAVALVLLLDRD
jgi:hypothetical protein